MNQTIGGCCRWTWVVLLLVCCGVCVGACSGGLGGSPPAPDASAAADLAAATVDLASAADLAAPADLALPSPDLVHLDLAHPDLAEFACYEPGSFPTFRSQCAVDGDCFAGIHQIDCCGSHAAHGVATVDQQAFVAAEAAFRVVCPANCKCVARPTLCDDGKSAPDNQVTVACEKGRCVTHGL